LGNSGDIHEVIEPIVESLMNRNGPKASDAVHGSLGLTYHLLRNQDNFRLLGKAIHTSGLSAEVHERFVVGTAEAVLETVENNSHPPPPQKKNALEGGLLNCEPK